MVAAVHGLEVEQPVRLANGVHLFPFAAAPDSPNLRALGRRYQGNPWAMLDVTSVYPPTIAVFDMGTVAGAANSEAGKAANDSAYGALLDAARGFTLTDRCAPVVGNSWTDFIDPALTLAEFGQIYMGPRFEGAPSETPLKVDSEALAWAERYLQTTDAPLRRSVDVALDRLNVARRRRSPGNRAIDCCICLEALLGDDDTQELTYKLRLRAALLLGTALPDRREIRKAVRDLYELRSKVVHGRARSHGNASSDERCASRGLEICAQAVRAIVQRNALPDFATWELTGGT
jgi:hypothetical protein